MVVGKNFGELGKSRGIRQSFTHPNLYYNTLGTLRDEQIVGSLNGGEHVWPKLVTTKSTLDSVLSPLQPSLT